MGQELLRSFEEGANFHYHAVRGAKGLVVFVHGLNGTYDESYWGNLGKLLAEDFRSKKLELLFWGYHSNSQLLPNKLALIKRAPRIVGPRDVSDQIATYVRSKVAQKSYAKFLAFGHSLGGCVVADFYQRHCGIDQEISLDSICMASTPTDTHNLARWHSTVGAYSNPQIGFLASKSEMDRIYRDAIPSASRSFTETTYLRAINDEVVKHPPAEIFNSRIDISGTHDWPKMIRNRTSAGYAEISDWISKCVQTQ